MLQPERMKEIIEEIGKARVGRDKMKRKTQERMERRSRKKSSSAGSEKMERVGDR